MSNGTLVFIGLLVMLVIAAFIAIVILTNALIVNPLKSSYTRMDKLLFDRLNETCINKDR